MLSFFFAIGGRMRDFEGRDCLDRGGHLEDDREEQYRPLDGHFDFPSLGESGDGESDDDEHVSFTSVYDC